MLTDGKPAELTSDYRRVRRAIAFICENRRDQPPLDDVAAHVGLSAGHLQDVFTRWAGLSHKAFVKVTALNHARTLLHNSADVLDVAHAAGLSGPGRRPDLFVTHEGMSPGIHKVRGRGITVGYGFHPSPFGMALVMTTQAGLCGLAFADEGEGAATLADMRGRWPQARFEEEPGLSGSYANRIFDPACWRPDTPLHVVFIGTDFDIKVWETLLGIPLGKASSYSDIAIHLGKPRAARAVGAAVGRNPVSFVVPCHRVLGKMGSLCGYHWGLTRKRAILGWEAGLLSAT